MLGYNEARRSLQLLKMNHHVLEIKLPEERKEPAIHHIVLKNL
jgi:hypothetical protein